MLMVGAIVSSVAVYLLFDSGMVGLDQAYESEPPAPVEVDIVEPTLLYGMVVDSLHLTEGIVRRN